MCDSLRPHGLQHARLPCPSPSPGACSNSWPLSRWCLPTISSSAIPFSSCLQSFPASGSFPVSQFFTSGSQSIGVSASASVLPMNSQDWFSLGWTGSISLQSKGLSRAFSSTTVQKHQFFSAWHTGIITGWEGSGGQPARGWGGWRAAHWQSGAGYRSTASFLLFCLWRTPEVQRGVQKFSFSPSLHHRSCGQ